MRIIGEGPLRADLEAWIADHDAGGWVDLLGHVDASQLRDEYRRAWIVASASLAEGWGLSLTEARGVRHAGRGHRHPRPPLLGGRRRDRRARRAGRPRRGASPPSWATTTLRHRLADGALARARTLTWDASALGVLRVFHRVLCT